jgi:hypothetical protein
MRRLLVVVSITGAIVLPACNCGKNVGLADTNGVLHLDSNELDFGPVTEFTTKTMQIHIGNTGKGSLTIMSATLDPSSSADFTLGTPPTSIEANGSADLDVTFSPIGPGEDTGAVNIVSDDPDHPNATISLHGGPIGPVLEFDPDGGALPFAPTSMQFTAKMVGIRSVGGSTLHVTSVGVNGGGNPDFSVVPPALPASIKPGQAIAVEVDYSRSMRATNGILEVINDGADGGLSQLLLLPDPAKQCGDGLDNDGDGLIDFPDDPGCTDVNDDDEYNPPECIDGGMRPCGSTTGVCTQGTQTCGHSVWGTCGGGTMPMQEICNGLDDNCNGTTDEGVSELCTINGCQGARVCLVDAGIPDGGWSNCIPVNSMPEICNGIDDNCNGLIDEGIVQTCAVAGCQGVRICIPGGDGGWTSCMPTAPSPEVCDGIDNDCNGIIDDGIPMQTCGQGICVRTAPGCVDGGRPVCVPGTPQAEICNGLDDNCNGTIDDGIANLTCGTGACFRSVQACLADGGMSMCVPGMTMPEVCNNIDDNCNGTVDEGVTQACYTGPGGTSGVGPCHGGTSTCTMGAFGSCVGQVTPVAETCNNVDDNCNGSIDDGLTQACYTGAAGTQNVGPCHGGTSTCVAGAYGACAGQVTPVAETCNNVDDNCNGATDEGLTQACYTGPGGTNGVGTCHGGTSTCAAGVYGACTGQVTPVAETCNNLDDDCNGTVDNGVTQACYTGPAGTSGVGPCHGGTSTCTAGIFGSCMGQVTPGTETCNNMDDNCNGVIDDGVTQACYTGPAGTNGVGVCHGGTQTCSAGTFGACTGQVTPATETCNNLDDNCNGTIDEGLTQACYTGPAGTNGVGPCHGGTQTCAAGSYGACTGQVLPIAEICGNGIDDNCNGTVDDGCSGCTTNGGWHVDGGAVSYTCCYGIVNISITDFTFSTPVAGVTQIQPQPTWSPGATRPLKGPTVTCPTGFIDAGVVYAGGCTETYRLQATMTGPNTWDGTFTFQYVGNQCNGTDFSMICLGDPCTTHSQPIQGWR